eukprot:2915401-Rhodomonas_salina.2
MLPGSVRTLRLKEDGVDIVFGQELVGQHGASVPDIPEQVHSRIGRTGTCGTMWYLRLIFRKRARLMLW